MTIDDDKDVLAAEYVLGTLDADGRANVAMLMAMDPEFVAGVRTWERRLGELHALVAPVEPPKQTWDWIKARIATVRPSGPMWLPDPATAPPLTAPEPMMPSSEPRAAKDEAARKDSALAVDPTAADPASAAPDGGEVIVLAQRARTWQRIAGGIGALAAALVAIVLMRELRPELMPEAFKPRTREVVRTVEVPSPRMAEFVAVFQKDDASPAFLLTVDVERRMVSVRKVGAPQEAGKSYEVWIQPAGASAPRSLGLVEDRDFTVRRALADYDAPTLTNATFGVSLEPAGGSPTGKPTGPVFHSKLLQTTPPGFPSGTP
jgi:anti-sigma-K factor RskA